MEVNMTTKIKQSNTFSQVEKKLRKPITTIGISLWAMVLVLLTTATPVFAGGLDTDAGVAQFDAVVSFLATWIGRIGGLVMFLGIIQFALAVYNQSPEGKINGFLVLVAGAMLLGISLGYQFFLGN